MGQDPADHGQVEGWVAVFTHAPEARTRTWGSPVALGGVRLRGGCRRDRHLSLGGRVHGHRALWVQAMEADPG